MFEQIKQKFNTYIDGRIKANMQPAKRNVKAKKLNPYAADYDIYPNLTKEQKQRIINNVFKRTAKDFTFVSTTKGIVQDSEATAGLRQLSMCGAEGDGQDKIFTFFGKHSFIGWQLCALIAQHWLVNNACSIPAEDAVRPSWENFFTETKDNDTGSSTAILKKLKELTEQKYNLSVFLHRYVKNMKVFGVAYLLPIIEGIDYSQPYNPDGIKQGSFKGLSLLDPYWVQPQWSIQSMSNPASLHFYEPTFYQLANGLKVHHTHILKAVNSEVPDILKPTYYFGGIPLTQMIYERVYAAEKVANEAPLLALTKRMSIIYTNLADVLSNPETAGQNLATITKTRDNQGILLQDTDSRYEQHDISLADFDRTIGMQYQLVAAVAKIPVEKLLKTPISGLGQTGSYAENDYKQELQSLQTQKYIPVINRINEIVMRSDLERTEIISAKFNPIDSPTEREKAEIQEIKARVHTTYAGAGIITPEEVRDEIRFDKDSGYSNLSDEIPADFNAEEYVKENGGGHSGQAESGQTGTEVQAKDEEFNESDHPRNENGEFTKKGSASTSGSETSQENEFQFSQEQTKELLTGNWKDTIETSYSSLEKTSTGNAYIENKNANYKVFVPRKVVGEIKTELFRKNYDKETKAAMLFSIKNMRSFFEKATKGEPHKDRHNRANVKQIIPFFYNFKLTIEKGETRDYKVKFTVREFENGTSEIDEEILKNNQGKDVRLYSMSTKKQ